MIDDIFLIMLEWFMVSDPWPLDEAKHDKIEFVLNIESKNRGYDTWVDAYHDQAT